MAEDKLFNERWDEIEDALEEYLEKIGAKVNKPERVEQILNAKYDDKLKWGHEECGESASILRSHSTYLQQEYNAHRCKYDWCNQALSYLLAKYWEGDDKRYFKREDKAAKLASNNTGMQALLKLMYTAQTFMTALDGISDKVAKEADSLEKLQYTKRKIV